MILLLFAFGRCSSGLGTCFTIKISACATTLSAFMEKVYKRLHYPPGIAQGILQRYGFFFRALAYFLLV